MAAEILESTTEFKKYLRKLRSLIETQAKFKIFKTSIVDKKRFDDILCCIDASWPEEYKRYISRVGSTRLKSPGNYNNVIKMTKNKFMFSSSFYAVNTNRAIKAIEDLIKSIDNDVKFIKAEQSN